MLSRDMGKCTDCDICSRVCPTGAIEVFRSEGKAEPPNCAKCGHCEAFCPAGAIHLEFPGAQPYAGKNAAPAIGADQIELHMANRRSVRRFEKSPVERPQIERLLEIVRFAPTANNARNVEWRIVHKSESMRRVLEIAVSWMEAQLVTNPDSPYAGMFSFAVQGWEAGVDNICRGSPHAVIAHGPADKPVLGMDAVIGATYLELAAPTLGIGTCWAGMLQIAAANSPDLRRALGIPESHAVLAALMLGHPELSPRRVPKRPSITARWM